MKILIKPNKTHHGQGFFYKPRFFNPGIFSSASAYHRTKLAYLISKKILHYNFIKHFYLKHYALGLCNILSVEMELCETVDLMTRLSRSFVLVVNFTSKSVGICDLHS